MSEELTEAILEDPDPMTAEVVVHRIVGFDVGGDGRTLHTRIIPWNTPAQVSDPPHYRPYRESWSPGAFDKQLNAANRVDVLMNFEHEQGIGGVVGRGIQLSNEPDGLHGVFRMLGGSDGDKALELVNEGVLTGLSVEAVVRNSRPDKDGLVVRTEGRLVNVALCRTSRAAFKDAQVLAVRQENEEQPVEVAGLTEALAFLNALPELDVARFEAIGLTVPNRHAEMAEAPSDETE